MARTVLTGMLIVSLYVLTGCGQPDSGRSQIMPPYARKADQAPLISAAQAGETDIVEHLALSRRAYRQGLESLIQHYETKGDNMKSTWARNELKALDDMPQYNYIIEATIAGPNLKASSRIAEAELLYIKAAALEKRAKRLIVYIDEDLLRDALETYNELIRRYPTSYKIDDAAYEAAGILEHFKDYSIALIYYQRTYQWDPQTLHPAKYKAAHILDVHLARRAEALGLYQEAVKQKELSANYREFALKRIKELTGSEKKLD